MKKALFLLLVFAGILFSAGFAFAHHDDDHHGISISIKIRPNYSIVNSYYRAPSNSYYVPQQPRYYGYGSGTYYPRGYYYVYSPVGYYSGPVVVYR